MKNIFNKINGHLLENWLKTPSIMRLKTIFLLIYVKFTSKILRKAVKLKFLKNPTGICDHRKNINYLENCIIKQHRTVYGEVCEVIPKDLKNHIFSEEDEGNILYYLGDIAGKHIILPKNDLFRKSNTTNKYVEFVGYKDLIEAAINKRIKIGYCLPIIHAFNLLDASYKRKKILYRWGDMTKPVKSGGETVYGVIGKARLPDALSISLLKLNPNRHWHMVRSAGLYDGDFQKKKPMAVWRGGTTGFQKKYGRIELVQRYFADKTFDIGFSRISNTKGQNFEHFVKSPMTMEEQLQHKFLICVEGNDVSSGLKWMLNSRSAVMMSKPTVCSWLREDQLKPYVHYIPLAEDFSDLNEKFEWAMENEDACIDIIDNASKYIEPFLDFKRELMIEGEVLRRYLDSVDRV
jgi:hypothetical protein